MNKEQIFEILKDCIVEILPDIDKQCIRIEESLKNLGANSIDRMDILISAMENLNIRIPMVEFGQLKNIEGIVELLYQKKLAG